MYPFKDSHIIMDNDNLYKILENFEIKSALDLKNDKQLISYKANTEEPYTFYCVCLKNYYFLKKTCLKKIIKYLKRIIRRLEHKKIILS